MNINDCYNFEDFRKLAKKKLPSPIFNYIDGGADDEITLRRNTEAFDDCDLVPNILNNVVDRSGLPTLAGILGTKSQSLNESVFLLNVDSSSAPPSI